MAVPFLLNAVTLLPELTIPAPSVNDDVYHYLFIQRASQALDDGENVLDHWLPQVETGVPQFLYYQHLPALTVVAIQHLSFGTLDLLTTFNLVRYLLLIAFPLTVFVAMRLFGFSSVAAAMAAALSTLLSSDFRYGFEYDSYIFRGLGLFTQLFAMHLSFLTVAVLYRAIQLRKGLWIGALLFGLLVLTHVLYAYMTAMAIGVLFLVGLSRSTVRSRLWALVVIGGFAGVISASMWWPFLTNLAFLNATPYLQPEKYDSFGAGQILGWLATGDLFDHGRLPVLTALFAVGVVAAVLGRTRRGLICLILFAVWLVVYFGRPTLGPLVDLLPLHDGLLLHRFSGAVDLAAIILMGIGGAAVWERLRPHVSPARTVAVGAGFLVLLAPAVAERASFYADNTTFLARTNDAVVADRDAATILATIQTLPPDRTYAGLPATYARTMRLGDIYFYDLLTFRALDGFAPPNESISFNADFIWDFDEAEPADYDLYDARYVVAPTGRAMAAFLKPIKVTGRYTLYEAPTSGYARYVRIASRQAIATKAQLFETGRAWERSVVPDADAPFIRFDYPATTVGPGPMSAPGCPDGGQTTFSHFEPGRMNLVVECSGDSTLVLKTTFHPNWHVTIDGVAAATFMVSPSYIGISMPAGTHQVNAVYEPTPSKTPLFLLGLVALGGLALLRDRLDRPPRLGRRRPSSSSGSATPGPDPA